MGDVVHVDFGAKRVLDRAPTSEDLSKLSLFEKLIGVGLVYVTLDPNAEGVKVPEQFKGDPNLTLSFSHKFRVSDFAFDKGGVRASLRFGPTNFFCDIPWPAVKIMRSGADPKELLEALEAMEDNTPDGAA